MTMLATTSYFTAPAQVFQRTLRHRLALKDYDDLVLWISMDHPPEGGLVAEIVLARHFHARGAVIKPSGQHEFASFSLKGRPDNAGDTEGPGALNHLFGWLAPPRVGKIKLRRVQDLEDLGAAQVRLQYLKGLRPEFWIARLIGDIEHGDRYLLGLPLYNAEVVLGVCRICGQEQHENDYG